MTHTNSLLAKLVSAQLNAQTHGSKRAKDSQRRAIKAVQRAGVDAFFGEQVAAMTACGHWARQVAFSEKGIAMLQFVGLPGRKATPGRNVAMLSVEVAQTGEIAIWFDSRAGDRARVRQFAPEWFNRSALVNAYSGFVSDTILYALSTRP